MTTSAPVNIICNGAEPPGNPSSSGAHDFVRLEYRDLSAAAPNMRLQLPKFASNVFHLPDRVLDLLEIAAYVYCADRQVSRGTRSDLEYHGWSRSFHFFIRVRDHDFWQRPQVRVRLAELLCFLSGDKHVEFTFQPGHSTPKTNLFDTEEFGPDQDAETEVVLFSGGLDSLTGVLQQLTESQKQICLVSHRSGQPATSRTQDQLVNALSRRFPGRLKHYKFQCGLKGTRAREETQRTRFFLYTSIAYALASVFGRKSLYVYENGITSLNFPKRQDLMNARSSRTTHPKTIHLLQSFFAELTEGSFEVMTPFFWKTKTDMLEMLAAHGGQDLLSSAVSCSKTFKIEGPGTHCGGCSQCVDRRFATFGSGLQDYDDCGIYALDFLRAGIADGEIRTTLIDFVRQAREFGEYHEDRFYRERMSDLADVVDYLNGMAEDEAVHRLWTLCRRHGQQVEQAIRRMRELYDHPWKMLPDTSFLRLIGEREHLKEPVCRLVEDISKRLTRAIPTAFRRNRPDDENDLNDKISACLQSDRDEIEREHPSLSFALAHTVPDHSYPEHNLWIETKYIRGKTSPSKVTDGLAADLTKYRGGSHLLFVVYDPDRAIHDDSIFRADFEREGQCTVCIIR